VVLCIKNLGLAVDENIHQEKTKNVLGSNIYKGLPICKNGKLPVKLRYY